MKNILCILIFLFFISCNTQPEPIVIGKDVCSSCKMPVSDAKFGAEIITVKGKIYKFDDIICLLNFNKNEIKQGEKIKTTLTVNYSDNQKLIDVNQAFFLISDGLRTPMNSRAASFESREEAELFQKEFAGKILSWQEINQTFN